MGWARPAQLSGPDSTPKGLGGLAPKGVGPISAHKFSYFRLGQTRPRRQGWARISLAQKVNWMGHNQPGPEKKKKHHRWARIRLAQQQNWRGELFSPNPPACRTNIVLHAGGNTATESKNKEGEEGVPGAE